MKKTTERKPIKVIVKEPWYAPQYMECESVAELFEGTGVKLEEIRFAGDIYAVYKPGEGGRRYNTTISGIRIHGPIVFAGIGHPSDGDGGIYKDVPITREELKKMLPHLWK